MPRGKKLIKSTGVECYAVMCQCGRRWVGPSAAKIHVLHHRKVHGGKLPPYNFSANPIVAFGTPEYAETVRRHMELTEMNTRWRCHRAKEEKEQAPHASPAEVAAALAARVAQLEAGNVVA